MGLTNYMGLANDMSVLISTIAAMRIRLTDECLMIIPDELADIPDDDGFIDEIIQVMTSPVGSEQ